MIDYSRLTVAELLDAFASNQPVPGGGSASALAGAIGASLLIMVAGLPRTRHGTDEERAALVAAHPHLGAVDEVPENDWQPLPVKAPAKATFRNAVKDFYLTNPIARASAVMAELSAMAKARAAQPLAAE